MGGNSGRNNNQQANTADMQGEQQGGNDMGGTTDGEWCVDSYDPSRSLYIESVSGNVRNVIVNGIPNTYFDPTRSFGAVCETPYDFSFPTNPSINYNNNGSISYADTPMGPVGVLKSGTFIFNHLSDTQGSVAWETEQVTLDVCTGHADPTNRYHIHGPGGLGGQSIPDGETCGTECGNCKMIGYMLDGFPIYSTCEQVCGSYQGSGTNESGYSWTTSVDCTGKVRLDEANGVDADQHNIVDSCGNRITGYAYFITFTYPYVPIFYAGTPVMGSRVEDYYGVYGNDNDTSCDACSASDDTSNFRDETNNDDTTTTTTTTMNADDQADNAQDNNQGGNQNDQSQQESDQQGGNRRGGNRQGGRRGRGRGLHETHESSIVL